jgi:hypothetical protein
MWTDKSVGEDRQFYLEVRLRHLVVALAVLQDAEVVERLGVVGVDRHCDLEGLTMARAAETS